MELKDQIKKYAEDLKKLEDRKEAIAVEEKQINENIDMIQVEFTKLLKDNHILEVGVEGVGKIKFASNSYSSIPKSEREKVFEALRSIGEGALIKSVENVNKNTLNAWVRGRQKENLPIPEGIKVFTKESVEIEGKSKKKKESDEESE